jgi:protein-arginine kinase activator protein McsA
MGGRCLLCQNEAQIKVSIYEGGEKKSFYVCRECGEYIAYRFFYLDREIEKMEMEKEGEDE